MSESKEKEIVSNYIQGIKRAVITHTPPTSLESVVNDLTSLNTFDVDSFKNVDCEEMGVIVADIIERWNLDFEVIGEAVELVNNEIKRAIREYNVAKVVQKLNDESNFTGHQKFVDSIQQDYLVLATSYVDKGEAVTYNQYLDDLTDIYNKYRSQYTVDEFYNIIVSSTRLSFPPRLHENVERGITEIIDRCVAEEKDPRCCDDDLLTFFIQLYDKLTPEEKDNKWGPLYAQKYIRSTRQNVSDLYIRFSTCKKESTYSRVTGEM